MEKKINKLLKVDNDLMTSALCWEHWLHSSPLNTGRINASHTFYYICLGIFSAVPIASYIYGAIVTGDYERIKIPTIITLLGYGIYLTFTVVYIINIFTFNKKSKEK